MDRIHKFYREAVQRFVWIEKAPGSAAAKPVTPEATKPDFKDTEQYKEAKDAKDKYGQGKDEVDFKTAFRLAEAEFQKNYATDSDAARAISELEVEFEAKKEEVKKDFEKRKEEAAKKAKEKVESEIKKDEGLTDIFDAYKVQIAGQEITLTQGEYEDYLKAPDKTVYLQGKAEKLVREMVEEEFKKKVQDLRQQNIDGIDGNTARYKEGNYIKDYVGGDYQYGTGPKTYMEQGVVRHTAAGIADGLLLAGGKNLERDWMDMIKDQENEEVDAGYDQGLYYHDLGSAMDKMMKADTSVDFGEMNGFFSEKGGALAHLDDYNSSWARGLVLGYLAAAGRPEKDGGLSPAEEKEYVDYVKSVTEKANNSCDNDPAKLYTALKNELLTPALWKEMKKAQEDGAKKINEELDMKETEESYAYASADYNKAVKEGFEPSPELQALKEVLPVEPVDLEFNHKAVAEEFVALLEKELKPFNEKKEAEALAAAENYKKAAEAYKSGVDEYVAAAEKMTKGIDDAKTLEDLIKLESEGVKLDSLNKKVAELANALNKAAGEAARKTFSGSSSEKILAETTAVANAATDSWTASPYEPIKAAYEAKKKSLFKTVAPAGEPGKAPGAPEAQKEKSIDELRTEYEKFFDENDPTTDKSLSKKYKDLLLKILFRKDPQYMAEDYKKGAENLAEQFTLEVVALGSDKMDESIKQLLDNIEAKAMFRTDEIDAEKQKTPPPSAEQLALLEVELCELRERALTLKQYRSAFDQLKTLTSSNPEKAETYNKKRALVLARLYDQDATWEKRDSKQADWLKGQESMKGVIDGLDEFEQAWDTFGKDAFELNPDGSFKLPEGVTLTPEAEEALKNKGIARLQRLLDGNPEGNVTINGRDLNYRAPGGYEMGQLDNGQTLRVADAAHMKLVPFGDGKFAPFILCEKVDAEGKSIDPPSYGWVALNLLRKGKGEGGGGGKKEKEKDEKENPQPTPEVVLENRVKEIVDLLTGAATLIENCNVPPKTDEDRQRLGEGIGKYIRAHATYDEMMSKAGTIMKTPDGKSYPKGPVKIKLQNPDYNREVQWNGKELSIPGGMAGFFSGADLDNGKGAYENCVRVLTAKKLPTDPKALEKWATENGCLVHDDEVLHYDRKEVTPDEYNKIKAEIEKHDAKWKTFLEKVNAEIETGTFDTEGHTRHTDVIKKAQFMVKHLEGCLTMMDQYNDIIGEVPTTDPHLKQKLYTKDIIKRRIASLKDLQETMAKAMGPTQLTVEDLKMLKDAGIKMKEKEAAEPEVRLDISDAMRNLLTTLYGDVAKNWTAKDIADRFSLDMSLVKDKKALEITVRKGAPIDQDTSKQNWEIQLSHRVGSGSSVDVRVVQTVKMVGKEVYNPDKVVDTEGGGRNRKAV